MVGWKTHPTPSKDIVLLKEKAKIAIVGGGVAGASAALYFGQLGLDVTLFEKESSLVSGPPFCHLHAGGNLYPDISDEQCLTLLKQSIDFLRFYPFIVDYRPTVIALPLTCDSTPTDLLPRLEKLRSRYEELIEEDENNKVLGESSEYYRYYEKEEIEALKEKEIVTNPTNSDEWMITVAKNIDLDKVQFPLIMVQEYGLNLFRLASGAMLALQSMPSVTLKTQSIVSNIQEVCDSEEWSVTYVYNYETHTKNFDYLINAAGFRTGKIDDMLGVECERMVEFKAAYVSYWEEKSETLFPEIIFHGKRGTPEGMGQFTPYPHGYFQLHGMTKEITLYDEGLVSNTTVSCQPKLGENFIEKIEKSWTNEETTQRTKRAIKHLSKFIPAFAKATVASKPLFGAQQIPGDDPTLRVAEVSFPAERYARCEIVKVSSVMDMIDAITKEFTALGYIEPSMQGKRDFLYLNSLHELEVSMLAEMLCAERQYPAELAHRNMPK
ncbi:MAG: FAD-dependent oxidoreductase [Epsilonproteobacteria bacterium]|nr:MAG: FAD-dependent oxidoreductase [Campylobacterota bacterium]